MRQIDIPVIKALRIMVSFVHGKWRADLYDGSILVERFEDEDETKASSRTHKYIADNYIAVKPRGDHSLQDAKTFKRFYK